MNRKKRNWIFCLLCAGLCLLLCLLPSTQILGAQAAVPRAKVRVEACDNSQLAALGVVYSGLQYCQVTILDGPFQGSSVTAVNHMSAALDKDKLFAVGDKALAMVQNTDKGLRVTLIDHYRLDSQALLFGLFGVLLVLFAGSTGLGSLISLVLSVLVVWKLLIPLMLSGGSPILGAFATVLVLTVLIDLLVAGWSRVSAVAILGSLSGTLCTCCLTLVFGTVIKMDGTNLPYVIPILAQSHLQLNLREIFFSMVFVANSGALMDLSMDIATACGEIVIHHPGITRRELLKSGFAVGRHVIGTMTTTLMLAYSGSYLSMLLYFSGQGTPIIDILNLKYVASEVLITLVGSFGLVTVAPFSALMACVFLTKRGGAQAPEPLVSQDEDLKQG